MPSYFPLPADFYLENKDHKVKSSITVFNYPSNSQINLKKDIKKDIYFCSYLKYKNKWIKLKELKCEYGSFLNFHREEFDCNSNEMIVVLASENSNNPKEKQYLAKPYSLRNDKSPVAERASYNFQFQDSISSFQGEYPYRMAIKSNGSFFSTDSLRLDSEENKETYVLLVNLNIDASLKNKNKISILDHKNSEIKSLNAYNNSFSIFKLPKKNKLNDTLFLTCKTSSFIPIFINIGNFKKKNEISVEHSHPPTEMLWGAEKFDVLKVLKSRWI